MRYTLIFYFSKHSCLNKTITFHVNVDARIRITTKKKHSEMPRQNCLFSSESSYIDMGSLRELHIKSSSLYLILMPLEDKDY